MTTNAAFNVLTLFALQSATGPDRGSVLDAAAVVAAAADLRELALEAARAAQALRDAEAAQLNFDRLLRK